MATSVMRPPLRSSASCCSCAGSRASSPGHNSAGVVAGSDSSAASCASWGAWPLSSITDPDRLAAHRQPVLEPGGGRGGVVRVLEPGVWCGWGQAGWSMTDPDTLAHSVPCLSACSSLLYFHILPVTTPPSRSPSPPSPRPHSSWWRWTTTLVAGAARFSRPHTQCPGSSQQPLHWYGSRPNSCMYAQRARCLSGPESSGRAR
jgi:hypothetical protein